jgi:hypothetical protein
MDRVELQVSEEHGQSGSCFRTAEVISGFVFADGEGVRIARSFHDPTGHGPRMSKQPTDGYRDRRLLLEKRNSLLTRWCQRAWSGSGVWGKCGKFWTHRSTIIIGTLSFKPVVYDWNLISLYHISGLAPIFEHIHSSSRTSHSIMDSSRDLEKMTGTLHLETNKNNVIDGESEEMTEAEKAAEKKLLRKIDFHVVPILWILYMLAFLVSMRLWFVTI